MVSVSGSPLTNHPSSSSSQNSPLAKHSSESSSSEATQRNHRSLHRPSLHASQSAPNVSGSLSNRQQSSSNHHSNHPSSHRQNAGQPLQGSYRTSARLSRPFLNESQSAPIVSKSLRSQHQLTQDYNLGSQEHSTSSSESLSEPSAYSMSVATSTAQIGNMQRTYYEGMVPMTPSEMMAEQVEKETRAQERAKNNRKIAQQGGKQNIGKEGGS
ncbi:hypothetical protein BKA65DRAFT_499183 [Rhexocercosporidium sp. MPI-PUGE-AT-0058]|nr:hypothetical protein BKA65DRAFT_499183 [Rhexocercosporidium sp. MPI-PUGE-AT-0058]